MHHKWFDASGDFFKKGARCHFFLPDIIMPDIEGPDVFTMFRQESFLKNIPIIFLTATIRRDEAIERQDQSEGGYIFLANPCTVEELITAIESQL